MREIMFRGKRLDNGKWVEGHLIRCENERTRICESKTDIFCYEKDCSIIQTVAHETETLTVGQYTGLKDKNGKRIFEGDIIKSDNGEQSSISVVKFGEYYPKMFYLMMDIYFPIAQHINANGFFAESTKHEDMILFKSPFFEIIGNVHDNPELLEK